MVIISRIIEEKTPQKSNVSRTNEKPVILIIGNLNHPNILLYPARLCE